MFEWVTKSYSMHRYQGKVMEVVLSIMYHAVGEAHFLY